jgi:hypothetical protein
MERLMNEVLPNGIGYEWTDLSYQQRLSGSTAIFIFPLCVLLAFLVLAAQYESWTLPLAVILIVPMSLLCAITGVYLTKGRQHLPQIGFLVLIGSPARMRLIVGSRLSPHAGPDGGRGGAGSVPHPAPPHPDDLVHAMENYCRWCSRAARRGMRHAMGVAVFSGMLGVTFLAGPHAGDTVVISRRRAATWRTLRGRAGGPGDHA